MSVLQIPSLTGIRGRAPRRVLLVLLAALSMVMTAGPGCSSKYTRVTPELVRSNKIFHFQHTFLPEFVFWDPRRSFNLLADSGSAPMQELWREHVADGTGEQVSVSYEIWDARSGVVVIQFPSPDRPLACYSAAIVRSDSYYRLFLLEKTKDTKLNNTLSCLCEVDQFGTRTNYGGRKYDDPESLANELHALIVQGREADFLEDHPVYTNPAPYIYP